MLKFFHVARIFNFCILLVDFSPNFKHVILSHLDELLNLTYMVGNHNMYGFHPNLNQRKIPLVD